jgi:endo-1,4-beta-xylanase
MCPECGSPAQPAAVPADGRRVRTQPLLPPTAARGLAVAAALALLPVATAAAAPLTAHTFTHRSGHVAEVGSRGAVQGRVLALGPGASARAVLARGAIDAVTVRLRLDGTACGGTRTTLAVGGRRVPSPRVTRRWQTFTLAVVPTGARSSLGLRFRARRGCRLLFDQGQVHPVAARSVPATPARPARPTAPLPAPRDEIALGAAVDWHNVSAMPGYGRLFLDNFTWLTPENEMKMDVLQPERGRFDFATADAMVAWAQAHGKPVHGHALVFDKQLPQWLTNPSVADQLTGKGRFDRSQLEQVMRDHITSVMQHYAASVHEWDVVNEALKPDGSYNPSIWLRTIGPDYIEEAYRAARAAVPSAKLCYNEIGDEVAGPEADAVFELVSRLRRDGLIDCVGFETHLNAATPPGEALLEQNLARFATLGVELHVSEMDVDVSQISGATASKFVLQAAVFAAGAQACRAVPACTRFTTWGMTDASSWLGPSAQALPFDRDLAPKPAWAAILRALGRPGPA